MKTLFIFLFMAILPLSAFAETLHCTSSLTNERTPLQVEELKKEISDFRAESKLTQIIDGTDFRYTITVGLTKDIMDDPDEPTYRGKPTLVSVVIFNSPRTQIARFDAPLLDAVRVVNLTVGSEEQNARFRIHLVCTLQ